MPSLKEVKDRIASVRSTLKITSAMKLVASSKLRKAQRSIEALRPYEEALTRILASVSGSLSPGFGTAEGTASAVESSAGYGEFGNRRVLDENQSAAKTIVVAFAGNSSMCGAFNANVIKRTLEVIDAQEGVVEVWAFGKKMSEAVRKAGRPATRDYSHLIANPSSAEVSGISGELRSMSASGELSRVMLVYNKFISVGRQQVVVEDFLGPDRSFAGAQDDRLACDYILEPSRPELLAALIPQVLDLRLYAALLDSIAAEHAARMVAMQAATDNGQELLAELTLEYNKGRQQKITAEILDLVAGGAN